MENVRFIVELYKEIPPLFSLFLKMVQTCFFFDLLLTLVGKTSKKLDDDDDDDDDDDE